MPPALGSACCPTIEMKATAFGLSVAFSRIVIVPVTVAGEAMTWVTGSRSAARIAIATSADSLRGIAISVSRRRASRSGSG